MLADEGGSRIRTGALSREAHFPGEWLSSLVDFIAGALPTWRDDPRREEGTGETKLTSQLCAYLNGLTRLTPGWDFLQFRREEPDESDGRRVIDLVVAPSGSTIWLAGRDHTEYQTLLPIECKRLPTPRGTDRDEREYLYSRFSTTGGIQRFKAGHHGATHARAAMIAYVQAEDIPQWKAQTDQWVHDLYSEGAIGWTLNDQLNLIEHNEKLRVASFRSKHTRLQNLGPIDLDHLWVDMSALPIETG